MRVAESSAGRIGLWTLAGILAVLTATGWTGTKVELGGGVYPRLEYSGQSSATSFSLMGPEADITVRISGKTRDIANGVLQLWAPLQMNDWTMGFHFGEAYVMVPLGLRLPTVRFGQAVIPFGLLADYDTHSQLVQTTYARTLALRIDPGLGIQGQLGKTNYAFWASNGSGPYAADPDKNKVVTARVAPRFLLGDAEMTWGLSGLAGELPYWRLDSMMHMMHGPHSYRMKYRAALDNTTDWGPATFRLEGVVGKDSALAGPLVLGYYAEARYAFTNWLEALVTYDGYHIADQGSHQILNAGLAVSPPELSSINLQVVFQHDWMKTAMMNERFWNVTTQLAFRF